jgi:hypothetical protein
MDCIITTYFTAEKDPQRPNVWANDDFSIIEKFYDGILKHQLNCLILIDNSSDDFIKKYETDKIKFLRCDSSGLNMVDIRWKLYANLLKLRTDIDRVFFVDVSDVLILKNPFNFIEPGKIYCGDEDSINMKNQWMMDRYFLLNQSTIINKLANYANKQVLNAGVLGGERLVIMGIAEKMANLLEISNVTSTTVDMCTFNHVLYMDYKDKLVHGLPVNTVFKTYDFDNKEAWFCHK